MRGAPPARRRVGREPGVGVGRVVGRLRRARPSGFAGSGSQRVVVLQLGGAGLAGDRARRGSPPPSPVPVADDGEHQPLDGARGPRAASRAPCGDLRGRGVEVERRAAGAAAPADRRGDDRHLQRGRLHAALADRRRADREVVADLARPRGIVLVAAPGMPGSRLKPKRSATSTSRRAPSSRAERGEDRVARLREGLRRACRRTTRRWRSRARRPRASPSSATGIRAARARRGCASSAPVERDDLERRARRLQAGEARCRRARGPRRCAGRSADDAAEAAGERGDGRALDARRRSSCAPARRCARRGGRERRGRRRAARRRGGRASRVVEDALEAADADLRVGRDAERAQLGRALGRDRAERADDRASRAPAERRGAVRAARRARVPSRARSVAARRQPRRRASAARRGAGRGRRGRARQAIAASSSSPVDGSAASPRTVPEDARRRRVTGIADAVAVALGPAGRDARRGRRRRRPRW